MSNTATTFLMILSHVWKDLTPAISASISCTASPIRRAQLFFCPEILFLLFAEQHDDFMFSRGGRATPQRKSAYFNKVPNPLNNEPAALNIVPRDANFALAA